MKIVAVMPIKLNNERLPGKNTMQLGEKPLLMWALDAMKKANVADEIYVYCSSEEIKAYLGEGIIYLKRPEHLNLPSSNFNQIFRSFKDQIPADIYIYTHATAPFVSTDTIKECVSVVLNDGYDSAFCAERIQDFLWKNGNPLNFDANNLPRSQDIEPIYRETSGIYVFKRSVFEDHNRRIGVRPYIKEVGYKEAVDINTLSDFKLAESLLEVDL